MGPLKKYKLLHIYQKSFIQAGPVFIKKALNT